jgi:hypothetical protein
MGAANDRQWAFCATQLLIAEVVAVTPNSSSVRAEG